MRLPLLLAASLWLSGCSGAARAQSKALEALPAAARGTATTRVESRHSADSPLSGGKAYVVEAELTEAQFVAWCKALGLAAELGVEERAAGEVSSSSTFRECRSEQQSIVFKAAAGQSVGLALFKALE